MFNSLSSQHCITHLNINKNLKKQVVHKFNLLSAKEIIDQSYGEVKIPKTIDYDIFREESRIVPIKGGLYCEDIFGKSEEYNCKCGFFGYSKLFFNSLDEIESKYDSAELKLRRGIFGYEEYIPNYSRFIIHSKDACDLCKSKITSINDRLDRWGHIKLKVPVAHILLLESQPSNLSILLNMHLTVLRKIIYYDSYIITYSKVSALPKGTVLSREKYNKAKKQFDDKVIAKTGSEPLKEILRNTDIHQVLQQLNSEFNAAGSVNRKRIKNKIAIIEYYRDQKIIPENAILDTLPVLPPDLRAFYIKDKELWINNLNELYKIILRANNHLKNLPYSDSINYSYMKEYCSKILQINVDLLFDKYMIKYKNDQFMHDIMKNSERLTSLVDRLFIDEINKPNYINKFYNYDKYRALDKIKLSLVRATDEHSHKIVHNKIKALCIKTKSYDLCDYLLAIAEDNKINNIIRKIINIADKQNLTMRPDIYSETFEFYGPGRISQLFNIHVRLINKMIMIIVFPEHFRWCYPVNKKTVHKHLVQNVKRSSENIIDCNYIRKKYFGQSNIQFRTKNEMGGFVLELQALFQTIEQNIKKKQKNKLTNKS